MPSHSVARAYFHERVAEIEKTERIVSVVAAGDGAYLVVTESKTNTAVSVGGRAQAKARETR